MSQKTHLQSNSANVIPKTAMIFAAGLGQRMLPITQHTPKPMVKILGRPLLDYRLDKLVEIGIKNAVINTHHLADIIESYVKTRSDIHVEISHEIQRLETGGGLIKALPLLGCEPFYIINSDIIWTDENTPSLLKLAQFWDNKKMDILMLLQPTKSAIGYRGNGDFNLTKDGSVAKTRADNHDYIYSGIMILNPEILKNLPKNITDNKFSLAALFKEATKQDGILNRIYGIEHKGHWVTIDRPEGIKITEEYLLKNCGFTVT